MGTLYFSTESILFLMKIGNMLQDNNIYLNNTDNHKEIVRVIFSVFSGPLSSINTILSILKYMISSAPILIPGVRTV